MWDLFGLQTYKTLLALLYSNILLAVPFGASTILFGLQNASIPIRVCGISKK